MSTLKKIADLNLDNNKVDLMKDSIFGSLSSVTNKKESSATLVASLCSLYDPSKRVFQLKDKTCFSFCTQEIAKMIGMQDSGIDFRDYKEQCMSLSSGFPKHLMDIRDKFVDNAKRGGPITASHIKDILRKMTVGDDESKLHFKKLMIYYLIEEVLLCGGNSKNPRKNVWRLVRNLEKGEFVNWSRRLMTTCISLWLLCLNIYLRYGRVHRRQSLLPIQKYASQRKDLRDVLRALKATHIIECPHCTTSSGGEYSRFCVYGGEVTDLSLSFCDSNIGTSGNVARRATRAPERYSPEKQSECCSMLLIDADGTFNAVGLDNFIKQVKLGEYELSYAVVAIMGPHSSGRSTLLNHLFHTNFKEMDAYRGRHVASLRQKFFHSIAPGGLAGDRREVVHASGFSFSAQQIWKVIKENKDEGSKVIEALKKEILELRAHGIKENEVLKKVQDEKKELLKIVQVQDQKIKKIVQDNEELRKRLQAEEYFIEELGARFGELEKALS
nr:RHD3/Sey1, P-loop containing nucleoside triphosphate hydrolase [Tanacetum cinerariifolium]